MYGLFEQLLSAAAVHQDRFRTKHFGNLCQYRSTTLSNQEVREHAQQRIGGDPWETVRTTAFQTYT